MGMAGALTGALALDIGNDTQTAGEAMAQERRAAAATLKQSWERIGQRLRAELGEDLYSSWFARMEAERLDAGKLVASVPTRFLRNWIEAHYADRLRRICEVELGPLDSVSIRVRVCGGMPARIAEPARRSAPEEAGQLAARLASSSLAAPSAPATGSAPVTGTGKDRGSPLDHGLTFETFVVGRSNELACSAARRAADARPGQPLSFNPLYIHSPAGQGKTHLLNAISWRIRESSPDVKVLYLTAERFMYHFIAALKERDTLAFKDYFQTINVLLIDDFQFLQGKTMQQEFCHTFNSLVDSKRQVIVAADVPPSQLETLEPRMRSRLAGGLVVGIETPDIDLRRSILKARLADAARHDPAIMIPDEVVEFLANRITGGGRELEGALIRVVASQQLTRAPMTVDLAAAAVRDLSHTPEAIRMRIDDILQIISKHYSVSRPDLLSPRRARSIVRPRQIGMYLAKKLTSRSLPEIGKRFGGRDHSTVLHAVRKIEELLKADEKLAREIALLTRMIEQH
jgi:chromosomal replication initiator protein